MGKLALYFNTLKNMKPSQVINRLRKSIGLNCCLGVRPSENCNKIKRLENIETLDFDPVFLARFPVDDIMQNKITLLHSSEIMDWKCTWEFEKKSALWNYNLHYFEYLFPLVNAWKESGEKKYLDKTVEIINGWIDSNLIIKSPAWASYTTAFRICIWISYYGYVSEALSEEFRTRFLLSLHKQYVYLTCHLEKDILGNHYFEDLKSILIASLFFDDVIVFKKALNCFKAECKEEILPDGMHFELSPMYHKIVFEGMLRVSALMRSVGIIDQEIETYLQPMLDVAYSFEAGLNRVPLFNDGGNNISKSLNSLLVTSENIFGLKPVFKSRLESSGYYIFQSKIEEREYKLIVDAGCPGPKYIPGHSHCDAMSYELFCDGNPVAVNCGTYAYQCKERSFFRSTAAHNTVMVDGTEQSQCWSVFRLAKRSSTKVLSVTEDSISMELFDQKGHKIRRKITFSDVLSVKDEAEGGKLLSYVHLLDDYYIQPVDGICNDYYDPYCVDYGKKEVVKSVELRSDNHIEYKLMCGTEPFSNNIEPLDIEAKDFKPLAYINKQLYFYKSGKVWVLRNNRFVLVVDLIPCEWKDKNRKLIRLFRREPKLAVPVDDHRMIIAIFRKLFLVDVFNKDVRVVFESRIGFSDPLNICKSSQNWLIVWGDYGPNSNREAINIYGLKDDLSVEILYSFQPGQIRHVHNIIRKNIDGYYIFTGDLEENAGIYSADNEFNHITRVLTGKQQYRAVVGFDTPNGLIYATDAVNEQNYVFLVKGDKVEQICSLMGSCIYGTSFSSLYYFSTTVEPDENRKGLLSWFSRKRGSGILSNEVTLVEVDKNMKSKIVLSYKKDIWPMKLMQYGSIQFPHGDSNELWIYPVAVKSYDGCAKRFI